MSRELDTVYPTETEAALRQKYDLPAVPRHQVSNRPSPEAVDAAIRATNRLESQWGMHLTGDVPLEGDERKDVFMAHLNTADQPVVDSHAAIIEAQVLRIE